MLAHVDLSDNELGGRIFSFLPVRYNRSLVSLNLSHNQFEGPIPDIFATILSNLQDLDLSYNHFSQALPKTMGASKKLRRVLLQSNMIGGFLSRSFRNFRPTEINLANNAFWCPVANYSIATTIDKCVCPTICEQDGRGSCTADNTCKCVSCYIGLACDEMMCLNNCSDKGSCKVLLSLHHTTPHHAPPLSILATTPPLTYHTS